MTSALYLEHYLDSLQHLPIELQRNFKLMRDLDDRAHGLMRTIDLMADELLPSIPKMDEETKKEKVNTIQGLFNKAKEYGDDKVQLAIQTYELVDKHIRRLDSDLARFESEIQEKVMSSRVVQQAAADQEANPTTVKKGRKRLKGGEKAAASTGKKKRAGASSEDDAAASRSAAKKKTPRKGTTITANANKEQEENADLDSVAGMAHPKLSEEWALAECEGDWWRTARVAADCDVRYAGAAPVERASSAPATATAVRSALHTAKTLNRKLQKVNLDISAKGVLVSDAETNDNVLSVSIYRISYCSADAANARVFAVVEGKTVGNEECHVVHVFVCERRKQARALALSLAHAFNDAYQAWQANQACSLNSGSKHVVNPWVNFAEESDDDNTEEWESPAPLVTFA
ncbi:uncharacterized protein LOC121735292 [Aricia agestis]|uniref:uncharacterized protein LOC121735292 n=1 Tax=Aricia agestis TaxID=91739 RepID=UPI001C2053DC|nr:uncharacterized protein LOC121735292 [Aricia agestis]